MDILAKTRQDYNLIAQDFSRKRSFVWQDLRPFLKLVNRGDKVLDAGCGNGRLFKELKKKKVDYLGIDFSENLLALARQQYPQAQFKLGDLSLEKTWQGLKDFDVCFCIAVLHTLSDHQQHLKVLRFIHQSLKKEGYLVLSVWNLWQKRFWRSHLRQLPWKISQGFKWRWLQVPYKTSNGRQAKQLASRFYYAFSLWELKRLAQKAGFAISKERFNGNFYLAVKK